MAKKVLILSSSPRKMGNSDLLCDRFMTGAMEAGNETERVFIRNKKINYCFACGSCQTNGGTCIQKDDMAEILDKMLAADVIALATPVYFYTMNAQLKTVIDRVYPKYTELNDKEFYFILSSDDSRQEYLERTVGGLRAFIACLEGAKERGIVYGVGAGKRGKIKDNNPAAWEQAYHMGKNV